MLLSVVISNPLFDVVIPMCWHIRKSFAFSNLSDDKSISYRIFIDLFLLTFTAEIVYNDVMMSKFSKLSNRGKSIV